jgi:hypothetical protein
MDSLLDGQAQIFIVPLLCKGMPSRTLRVLQESSRTIVQAGIPLPRVGTRKG